MCFSIRAPASSANLGPGFDALAVAIDLWLRVDVWPDDAGELVDDGSPDLHGGDNLVLSTAKQVATEQGWRLPGGRVAISSDIPVARGLGSSAAAIVCGIVLAARLARRELKPASVVDIAGQIEGHADNISAAVYGGVTVAVRTADGFTTAQLASDLPWTALLFVPLQTGLTRDARGILPRKVAIEDAAFNLGRTALLAHALRSGDESALKAAMDDRLHQPYRRSLFPHLSPVTKAAVDAGAVGACLSGAGPTILALATNDLALGVAAAMSEAARVAGVAGEVIQPGVATRGCHVAAC